MRRLLRRVLSRVPFTPAWRRRRARLRAWRELARCIEVAPLALANAIVPVIAESVKAAAEFGNQLKRIAEMMEEERQ